MKGVRNVAFTGIGGVAVAYPLLAHEAQAITYLLVGAFTVAAMIAGIRVHRPAQRRAWSLLAIGISVFVACDGVSNAVEFGLAPDPGGSVIDALYLVGYVPILGGLVLFSRSMLPVRARGLLLDAAIVSVSTFTVLWLWVRGPLAHVVGEGLIAALHLAADGGLIMVSVGLALLVGARSRTVATTALLGSIVVMVVGDALYAGMLAGPGYFAGNGLDAVWLTSYLLAAVAATDASMAAMPVHTPVDSHDLGRSRIVIVALAIMVGPNWMMLGQRQTHTALTVTLGAVFGLLVMARIAAFVDEQRRSQLLVSRSAERCEALLRHSSEAVLVLGPDLTIRFANPAVRSLVGADASDVMGATLVDVLHIDDLPLLHAALSQARANGSLPASIECRVAHADGSWRWVQLSATDGTDDPVVDGIVINLHDTTERKRAETRLTHEATHDGLTGLPNRSLLHDRLTMALNRAARTRQAVAVLYIDIDRFKSVNDSYGHDVGDALLFDLARRLQSVVRPSDTVARLGGDEFVVVCEGATGTIEARAVAERIRETAAQPCILHGEQFDVTVSVGVAVGSPGDMPRDVLRQADAALYQAKRAGRDCIIESELAKLSIG